MTLIELAKLMNAIEHIAQFDIDIEAVQEDPETANYATGIDPGLFPKIRSGQHRLEGLQWGYKKARSGYLPTLSLGGSLGSSNYIQTGVPNSTFFEQLKNNRQTYVYVALRISLFDKFTMRDNLRSISIDIRNQSLVLQEAENNLYAEGLKIENDLANTRQKLHSAQQSVVAHEEAFRFATEKFNAGKLSVYEHLQAKQRLANSQSQAVQAKYDLAYKRMVYEYYYKNQEQGTKTDR